MKKFLITLVNLVLNRENRDLVIELVTDEGKRQEVLNTLEALREEGLKEYFNTLVNGIMLSKQVDSETEAKPFIRASRQFANKFADGLLTPEDKIAIFKDFMKARAEASQVSESNVS